ncbi:hypothetical protein [Mycobacterium simiae]|uniref:hypothetical protein n=1 Tax=Mycobacterium simiae TaxID=1784 RepID=UPI0012DE2BA6|nr:hypothetical protein [Mycobacterium simiae]
MMMLLAICCHDFPLPLSSVPDASSNSSNIDLKLTPLKSSMATVAGSAVVPLISWNSFCVEVSAVTSEFERDSKTAQFAPAVLTGDLPALIMSSICSAVSDFL